jgi:hypothetical protein
LLEVIAVLCHEPLRVVNASVSYIFRSLGGQHPPTLLIDEADALFGTKIKADQNEDLRGLINAGYQRGLSYGRTVGPAHVPTEFETFAMAALAGIGRMPDTIEDRAVVVQMRRRKPSERVEPYRRRRDEPALEALHARIAAWAAKQHDRLVEAMPDLPVEDRAADTWEPLVAVADSAGGTWPARARQAAEVLSAEADEHDGEASLNVRLLTDIRKTFTVAAVPFMKSAVLCEHLRAIEDSPWRDIDLNPSKLGRRLTDYGIRSGHNTARTERGYRLGDFLDAFERYVPPEKESEGVQGVQTRVDLQKSTDAFERPDTFKASSPTKASSHNGRSDPMWTGSDGIGHQPCRRCGEPNPDHPRLCDDCVVDIHLIAQEGAQR